MLSHILELAHLLSCLLTLALLLRKKTSVWLRFYRQVSYLFLNSQHSEVAKSSYSSQFDRVQLWLCHRLCRFSRPCYKHVRRTELDRNSYTLNSKISHVQRSSPKKAISQLLSTISFNGYSSIFLRSGGNFWSKKTNQVVF